MEKKTRASVCGKNCSGIWNQWKEFKLARMSEPDLNGEAAFLICAKLLLVIL